MNAVFLATLFFVGVIEPMQMSNEWLSKIGQYSTTEVGYSLAVLTGR
jgi:hypothetical protein